MEQIKEFVISTHVALENRPAPYGLFHIVFVIVSLILIAAVCWLLRKSSDRTFRFIMLGTGIVLLLSEIYKQLYFYFAAGVEGYDWFIFPFQLCSVPMYVSIIVGVMKKNKVRDALCEYLASIGFLGGIMAYAEPSGMLNEHYFTLIHSCIWHALLIFIALYILVTDNACGSIRNYKKAVSVVGVVILMATALNIIFKSKQDFNMCYISPFYNTPLAVFSSLDNFFEGALGYLPGRILSIIIYIIAIILGGFIVYGVSYLIKAKISKKHIVAD